MWRCTVTKYLVLFSTAANANLWIGISITWNFLALNCVDCNECMVH